MADPAGSFTQLLMTLEQQDFFIGVLPFILTYVVFYLSLQQVPIFNDNNERMTKLFAVAAGFFVSYFLISNPAYQTFFVSYFGTVTVGLMGILGLFILLGITGLDSDAYFKNGALAILAVIVAAVGFTGAGGLAAFGLTEQGGFIGSVADFINYIINTGLIWGLVILGVVWFGSGSSRDQGEHPWYMNFPFPMAPRDEDGPTE